MTDRIRIATRGSQLALWQANHVADALRASSHAAQVDLVVIRTTGDRILDVPLSRIGDRGLFTKEIDGAILGGDADVAVHSLKDVPTRLPDGLALAAISERADPLDVLLLPRARSGDLHSLPPGARVGTSSLRRRAQLLALRPDLEVVDLRGNLNTRLARLDEGAYDAIILAAAGVERLGWADRIAQRLLATDWLPAVGQGALAIVAREGDQRTAALLRPLHHAPTAAAVTAERALLRALEGGCQVPIGALCAIDGESLSLDALVAAVDGSALLRQQIAAPVGEAAAAGIQLAERLRAAGADRILESIRGAQAAPLAGP